MNDDLFNEDLMTASFMNPTGSPLPSRQTPATSSFTSHSQYQNQQQEQSAFPAFIQQKEQIKVLTMKERGGVIMKHIQYSIVKHSRQPEEIIRRFSDFYHLHQVLTDIYPFRLVPPVPPKRVLGVDEAFVEQRRRGLERFINWVALHPILSKAKIVLQFLSVGEFHPFELHQEEFLLNQNTEFQVPTDLDDKLNQFQQSNEIFLQNYPQMISLLERICQRSIGNSLDYKKLSDHLEVMSTDHTMDCAYGKCRPCQLLDNGCRTVSQFFISASTLFEKQAKEGLENVCEKIKNILELYQGFEALFQRRQKLMLQDLQYLQTKVTNNQNKLNSIQLKAGGYTDKEQREMEKLKVWIAQDQKTLETEEKREAFMRFCIWHEFQWFHGQKGIIGKFYQAYLQFLIEHEEKIFNNWKRLEPFCFQMPITEFQ